MYYSNLNDAAAADTNTGVMPTAGFWRNRISPETEIIHVGCVPPVMTAYDPQIPVVIRPDDFIIFGVRDVCFCAAGKVVPAGLQFTVLAEIDYEEEYRSNA